MGLLTDRNNNKLERSNLIDQHALNREPVPLSFTILYGKGQTLDSSWEFRKMENEQIKSAQNNSRKKLRETTNLRGRNNEQ